MDFTVLQTFKERTVFELINMCFTKENTRKWQETDFTTFSHTCTGAKLTFTGKGQTT